MGGVNKLLEYCAKNWEHMHFNTLSTWHLVNILHFKDTLLETSFSFYFVSPVGTLVTSLLV